MKLRELKAKLVEDRCQIFVFDLHGNLIESCDSIFDTESLADTSVFDKWPVLESIQPIFEELGALDIPFRLPAVEFPLPDYQGIFDFEFYVHPEAPGHIVWVMIDQTRTYRYFQRIQQERNMLLLEKEYRETGRHIKITSALENS